MSSIKFCKLSKIILAFCHLNHQNTVFNHRIFDKYTILVKQFGNSKTFCKQKRFLCDENTSNSTSAIAWSTTNDSNLTLIPLSLSSKSAMIL